MLGNIAEQNTDNSAIVNTNDGKTCIASFDHHSLRNIAPGDPVVVNPTGRKTSPFYWISASAPCTYYRRYWEEDSGDLCSGWGGSHFLFEVHTDGCVSRQIQLFDNGKFLVYDEICEEDEFGGRSTVPLDLAEYEAFTISKGEFFDHWDPDSSENRRPKPGG